jgi:hypothetical protein
MWRSEMIHDPVIMHGYMQTMGGGDVGSAQAQRWF